MRKIEFLKIAILAIVSLVVCKQGLQNENSNYDIQIDSLTESIPVLSRLNYVSLETTELSLITDVDKILYNNHTVYLFGKVRKKFFFLVKKVSLPLIYLHGMNSPQK